VAVSSLAPLWEPIADRRRARLSGNRDTAGPRRGPLGAGLVRAARGSGRRTT
jgi:hypothetical protein